MEPILELARTYCLRVIEDAALALGATYRGRRVGGFGDVAAFSLAPGKILGAYGDAGAVVTNDTEIAERVRILRNYGHDPRMEEDRPRNSPPRDWNLLEEAYNERLDSLQAAILRAKLPTLDRRIDARRCIAKTYDRELAKLGLVTPYEPPSRPPCLPGVSSFVRERDRVRQHLQSRQIATQTYYTPPLHLQPAYRHLGFKSDSFPVSEHIGQSLLCLPIFPEMTDSQIGAVVDALEEMCAPEGTLTSSGLDLVDRLSPRWKKRLSCPGGGTSCGGQCFLISLICCYEAARSTWTCQRPTPNRCGSDGCCLANTICCSDHSC